MKINVQKRPSEKKLENKRIRRAGNIPASIYVRGKDSETIVVNGDEFSAVIRQIVSGRLSNTIFTLVDESGSETKAIVKEISYHPTTYQVLHLDFEPLKEDVPVNVKIPIEFTGAVDCKGIKLGGVLRCVIRGLRVTCLPKDIPSVFELNVKDLAMMQTLRLKDIDLPETVRPMADLNEVAVVIAKR